MTRLRQLRWTSTKVGGFEWRFGWVAAGTGPAAATADPLPGRVSESVKIQEHPYSYLPNHLNCFKIFILLVFFYMNVFSFFTFRILFYHHKKLRLKSHSENISSLWNGLSILNCLLFVNLLQFMDRSAECLNELSVVGRLKRIKFHENATVCEMLQQ